MKAFVLSSFGGECETGGTMRQKHQKAAATCCIIAWWLLLLDSAHIFHQLESVRQSYIYKSRPPLISYMGVWFQTSHSRYHGNWTPEVLINDRILFNVTLVPNGGYFLKWQYLWKMLNMVEDQPPYFMGKGSMLFSYLTIICFFISIAPYAITLI